MKGNVVKNTNIRHFCAQGVDQSRAMAAKALSGLLGENKDQPVLFLVSGGSSLSVVELIDQDVIGKNLEMCVIDERFGVPKEDQNFHGLSQTDFAEKFVAGGGRVCNGGVEGAENLESAGESFDQRLKEILAGDDEKPLVVALLGIGTDGHTVGVMPTQDAKEFQRDFVETSRFACGYDAGPAQEFPLRVTTTLLFLRDHVDHAVVFAAGVEKEKALASTLGKTGKLHLTPARIMREMKNVELYSLCVNY